MNVVTTIGPDLAKNVFQVHGVDASGLPSVHVSGAGGLATNTRDTVIPVA